jgi:geranylgeranyl diphosphate synthase type II
VRYSLLSGGKRVRPRLCLAAARCAGGEPAHALPVAAAVEMVHAFSLVHDDLPALDDDDTRRGQPTSHVRYGEAVAVLVGDALLGQAFAVCAERLDTAPEVRLAVVAELARGVAGMIAGQYLDVTADGEVVTLEQLRRLHGLKTGALIEASVVCGALVGGATQVEPYRRLGAELGLLFQIVDDVLDDGSDEPSYVNSLGLERARGLADEAHARARALLGQVPGDTAELGELADLIAHRTA